MTRAAQLLLLALGLAALRPGAALEVSTRVPLPLAGRGAPARASGRRSPQSRFAVVNRASSSEQRAARLSLFSFSFSLSVSL